MTTPTPAVFIPALLCNGELYRDVIAGMGEAIEAHVMLSPKPSLADSVADILARAPESFALVGTSYGGNLALEVALAAPERVTALWLMGCAASPPPAGGPDLAAALEATPDAAIAMLAGRVAHPDARPAAAAFRAMAADIGAEAGAAQARALATRRDLAGQLGALTMPALVLWGMDDALVPVDAGRALTDDLAHAHFHVLAGCGHLPTLEKPGPCIDLFAEFLHDEVIHRH